MIIRNLKLKIFLIKKVFPIFSIINKRLNHKKNIIFFYCNLSFRDNNKALYDYAIEHNYNKKYKIIVSSSDYKKYVASKPDNVYFVGPLASIFWYCLSKYVIYCIGKIPIELGKGQKSIYLNHGMPFKDGSAGEFEQSLIMDKFFTYMLSTGTAFVPSIKRIYSFPENKIVFGGNPKCDMLFLPSPNYDFGEYSKLIIWTPTFRKSISMNMDDTGVDSAIIPIVKVEEFDKINNFLKNINVKIVIKLHPEQDLCKYSLTNLEYFVLLSHQEFIRRKMDINRFMKQCDAMITDYSSIYYDFLLLNRPIGFTEDDIERYADKRGFAVDPMTFRPGMKLKTYDDICIYAQKIADGIDDYREEREKINSKVNEFRGGNFSKKIFEVMGI